MTLTPTPSSKTSLTPTAAKEYIRQTASSSSPIPSSPARHPKGKKRAHPQRDRALCPDPIPSAAARKRKRKEGVGGSQLWNRTFSHHPHPQPCPRGGGSRGKRMTWISRKGLRMPGRKNRSGLIVRSSDVDKGREGGGCKAGLTEVVDASSFGDREHFPHWHTRPGTRVLGLHTSLDLLAWWVAKPRSCSLPPPPPRGEVLN